VTLACWLTWVLCGLVAAFLLLVAALLTGDTAALVDQLQRNSQIADAGLSDSQVISTLWLTAAIGITWSLAAIGLAVLAYRRSEAGRIGLVVSAILSAVPGLLAVPVGWLNAAAAITTAVLLLRRPAQEWYAGRDRDADEPPGSDAGPVDRPTRPGPEQRLPPPPPSSPTQQPPGKPPVW
jgi:hypothetical protein